MIVTLQILVVEPKSTCSHCGSLYRLSQRVPVLPSTARLAVLAPVTDEAVAVLLSATFVVPQPAAGVLVLVGVGVLVGPTGVLVGGCTVGVLVLVAVGGTGVLVALDRKSI